MAVYLLHFAAPISPRHTCQHYIGWAEFWPDRVAIQRAGSNDAGALWARLCQVARERGIDFVVARIWPDGDRTLERQLKNRHNTRRLCPVCRGEMEVLVDVNFYLAQEPAQTGAFGRDSVQTVCAGYQPTHPFFTERLEHVCGISTW
jgi:hypothetical protein